MSRDGMRRAYLPGLNAEERSKVFLVFNLIPIT
jgi:hypothetical protein